MRGNIKTALILATLPVLLMGTAFGGEGVQVRITNDGTQDVVVTVYDMNAQPQRILLQNARINGFTSVPISAIGDATGRANLSWTATSTDAASPKCAMTTHSALAMMPPSMCTPIRAAALNTHC